MHAMILLIALHNCTFMQRPSHNKSSSDSLEGTCSTVSPFHRFSKACLSAREGFERKLVL